MLNIGITLRIRRCLQPCRKAKGPGAGRIVMAVLLVSLVGATSMFGANARARGVVHQASRDRAVSEKPLVDADAFADGADVSWADQLQANGVVFRNWHGQQRDLFDLLAHEGTNSIRLRVWVHPEAHWNGAQDLLREARRAARHDMRVMVDFHYSDTWADPGKQAVPAAWAHDSFPELVRHVYRYTRHTLRMLKRDGVHVAWVQLGNEINSGLLWPMGHTPAFSNIADLVNAGYRATKDVYPKALVVLHLANGYDNADFRWFFDRARAAGARWDVIGLSLYPTAINWHQRVKQAVANMRDMIARYHTDVIVSEVGMPWDEAQACRRMLSELLRQIRRLGPRALGVFYWEPEAPPGWHGYTKGASNSSGDFTQAMWAFKDDQSRHQLHHARQ